jgi:hypothetical protein
MDSWVPCAHVTLEALVAYEEFLNAHSRVKDETARTKERQHKYESFVGENGKFSAIAQRRKLIEADRAREIRRRQQEMEATCHLARASAVAKTASTTVAADPARIPALPPSVRVDAV